MPNVAARPLPKILAQQIVLAGGLDVMSPPLQMKPGICRAAQNFECSLYGGYRRIAGYERFDGQAKPSDATYTVLAATSITGGVSGDVLTGATSAATGTIIAVTGTQFILTKTTGTYTAGENLQVGGITKGVCSAAGVISGASTALLHATYKNLAADIYRALIAAVPGSGIIRGVWLYNDVVYAFRNNAGGTACALYKSSGAGWTAVSLGRELKFTSGNLSIAEGTVITGATSGATGTLKRQALETGTYAGSNATGTFVFATVTGTFQNGENLQTGGVTRAVANGADAAITLQPNGRFEFINANFTGSTSTLRMYWVDGVNRAHEFDGTTTVPINTGMTTDTPSYIAFHKYRLFLAFNASVQYSTAGAPYQWSVVTGANEIATGDAVTSFAVQPGTTDSGALAIFTKNRLWILYGSSASDFLLVSYRDQIGAFPYTAQTLAQTLFLDIQGVTDIATTINFGNFAHAVLTNQVKSTLTGWRNTAIASSVNRDLSQYRLFFTNNYALYIAMIGRKVIGIMPILYAHTVRCACEGFLTDGTEVSYFGGDAGFVFQMDKGTSFDGSAIEAYINLAYNFADSPRTLKFWRQAMLEISGSGYAAFNFGYSLGYGASDVIQPDDVAMVTNLSSVFWDAFTFDAAVWDGQTLTPSVMDMCGEAENCSIAVTSNADYYEPFTVSGAVLHYSMRREVRA